MTGNATCFKIHYLPSIFQAVLKTSSETRSALQTYSEDLRDGIDRWRNSAAAEVRNDASYIRLRDVGSTMFRLLPGGRPLRRHRRRRRQDQGGGQGAEAQGEQVLQGE